MTHDKIRQQCVQQYENASPFEQRLLQLCSVMYETRNRTAVLKCYQKTGLPFPEGEFTKVQHITPYMKRLQECHLLDEKFRCHPAILEFATRRAIDDGHYDAMVKAVLEEMPSTKVPRGYYGVGAKDGSFLMRDFRIGIYAQHPEMVSENYPLITGSSPSQNLVPMDPFLQVLNDPFDGKWFKRLSLGIRLQALNVILHHAIEKMEPDHEVLVFALEPDFLKAIPKAEKNGFYYLLVIRLVLGGRLKEARHIIEMIDSSGYTGGLSGWVLFMEGKNKEAVESYEADLKIYQKMVNGRNEYFRGVAGIFFILALLKTRDASLLPKIIKLIKKAKSYSYNFSFTLPVYDALDRVSEIQMGNVDRAKGTEFANFKGDDGLGGFFNIFASYWLNNSISSEEAKILHPISSRAEKAGWKWLNMECAILLSTLFKNSGAAYEDLAEKIRDDTGMVSILSMVPNEELWQKSLRALIDSGKPGSRPDAVTGHTRLVWLFSANSDYDRFYLQPLEQKLGKNGRWSKGRNVAMKRLMQGTKLPYITEQDKRISQAIRVESSYYSGPTYYFDREKASVALIGHPLVFQAKSPSTSVTIAEGEPVVSVKQAQSRFKIEFSPDISGEKVRVVEQTPTRFEVIQVNEEHRRIAGILGKEGLSVPLQGRDDVLAAIGAISSAVTVHSSLGGVAEAVLQTASDSVPRIRILPEGEGFRLEMLVNPFGEGGPYVKPGVGNETLIANVNGKRMQTRRDLKREEDMAAAVETACPSLFIRPEPSREWHLDQLEECLQVLTELKVLQDNHRVIMEWPEGEKLRVTREISFDRLRMGIRSGADWFEVAGGLELDEHLVMDMTKLLDLVRGDRSPVYPPGR